MMSILQLINPFSSITGKTMAFSSSKLLGHTETEKLKALDAIDILLEHRAEGLEFTNEIVEYWSIPRKIMARYGMGDVEQLNEWLDDVNDESYKPLSA